MRAVALLLALSFLGVLHYLAVQEIAIRLAGLRPTRIGIGVGPRIAVFRIRRRLLVINLLIPLGGYLQLQAGSWQRSGRAKRICVALASPIGIGVTACVILRPQAGLHSILSGFREIILGGVLPWKHGQAYWIAVYNTALAAPVLTLAGLVLAKQTALNLLPIPPTSGGVAVTSLLFGQHYETANRVALPFVCLYMMLILSWLVALVLALI